MTKLKFKYSSLNIYVYGISIHRIFVFRIPFTNNITYISDDVVLILKWINFFLDVIDEFDGERTHKFMPVALFFTTFEECSCDYFIFDSLFEEASHESLVKLLSYCMYQSANLSEFCLYLLKYVKPSEIMYRHQVLDYPSIFANFPYVHLLLEDFEFVTRNREILNRAYAYLIKNYLLSCSRFMEKENQGLGILENPSFNFFDYKPIHAMLKKQIKTTWNEGGYNYRRRLLRKFKRLFSKSFNPESSRKEGLNIIKQELQREAYMDAYDSVLNTQEALRNMYQESYQNQLSDKLAVVRTKIRKYNHPKFKKVLDEIEDTSEQLCLNRFSREKEFEILRIEVEKILTKYSYSPEFIEFITQQLYLDNGKPLPMLIIDEFIANDVIIRGKYLGYLDMNT